MSLGLIFLIVMQNFTAIRSAVLEKMTFEVAIFGNFPDIPELKLSLPLEHMAGVTTNNDPHRKSTPGHFSTKKSDRGFIFYDQRGHFSSVENVSLPLNQAEKSDPL